MIKSIGMVVGGFLAGGFVTAFFLHPPLSSSDWAAWVQAVGAIVGIGIAIAIPYYQHRREHAIAATAKTAREQGVIQNLIAITVELSSMLLSLRDYVRQKPQEFKYNRLGFEDVLNRLAALQSQDIGLLGINVVFDIRRIVTEVCTFLDRLDGKPLTILEPIFVDEFKEWGERSMDANSAAIKIYD